MFYIYILYSAASDIYYIGYTNDYKRRLDEHNHQDHYNTFTSKHRPWTIKAVFQCGDSEKEAIRIERFLEETEKKSFH